jgi:hypothetical protein
MLCLTASTFALVAMLGLTTSTFALVAMLGLTAKMKNNGEQNNLQKLQY